MARGFTMAGEQDVTVVQHGLINQLFATGGTIMCWVNASALDGSWSRLFDKGANQASGWTFAVKDNNQTYFEQIFTGANGAWIGDSESFALNEWIFVAVTYDSSSVDNDPILWKDETQFTPTSSPSGTSQDDSAHNLYIASRDGIARYIDASIAEVAMWNTILADDELVSLARGCNPFKIRNANLRLYMPLWGVHDPEINLVAGGLSGSLDNSPPQVAGPPVEPFNRRWWGTMPGAVEVAAPTVKPWWYYQRNKMRRAC